MSPGTTAFLTDLGLDGNGKLRLEANNLTTRGALDNVDEDELADILTPREARTVKRKLAHERKIGLSRIADTIQSDPLEIGGHR